MQERVNCEECGDTRQRKYLREIDGGILYFCHNCGDKGIIRSGQSTPTETTRNVLKTLTLPNLRLDEVKEITLPSDFSLSTIPITGQIWLSKYHILPEELKQFSIGYSERYKRLILPVFDETGLIYWQGRYLGTPDKQHPKYLNIRQSGAKNVYFRRNDSKTNKCNDTLVIVEDILSAIKVGRYIPSLSLLGSYFPSSIIEVIRPYKKVIIHLDDDKWLTAIKEARRINTLTGVHVQVNRTALDPKEIADKELEKMYTRS